MAGLDDLIEESITKTGPTCTMSLVMAKLDDEDQAAVIKHLFDWPRVQDTAISRALSKRGYAISSESVGRHRRAITDAPNGDRCRCQVLTRN